MNETTWQYTIQDFSPLVTYAGSNRTGGTNLDPTWSQSCPSGGSGPLSGNTLCDVQSVHTTLISGASVTLAFYGQAIELLGNVTGNMHYDVKIDGANIIAGTPSTHLASVSGLSLGNHTVSLTTKSTGPGTLAFQGAVVTVGTGLTGANVVRRAIQDNDIAVQYTANPSSAWQVTNYDGWGIQHTPSNTTWHQLNGNTSNAGSFTIPFQGNAILLHGFAWAYFPSNYRVSIDGEPAVTRYANSSLANTGSPGFINIDALMYFRANLSNDSHVLVVDNDGGIGWLGLDYVEVINVSAGSPFTNVSETSTHRKPIGTIVGLSIGLPLLILAVVLAFILYRKCVRRSDPEEIVQMPGHPHPIVTPFESPTNPSIQTNGKGSVTLGLGPFSRFTPLASASTAPGSASAPSHTNPSSSTTGKGRYLHNNSQPIVTSLSVASDPESPTQTRIRELQEELARAREHGSSNAAELQGLRQDLQQLMHMVDREMPRSGSDSLPPPEYTSAVQAAARGLSVDIQPPSTSHHKDLCM